MTDEWRPIETAPRDGTHILMYSADAMLPRMFLAFWSLYPSEYMQANGIDGEWSYTWEAQEVEVEPTHWMPLPEPPKT